MTLTTTHNFAMRSWNAPSKIVTDGRESVLGLGSVRDRLDWGSIVEVDSEKQVDIFIEEEDMDWESKIKKPRMEMVTELVKKKG